MNSTSFIIPDASRTCLDISTYTNYIIHKNIKETIELKNEVKSKGKIFNHNRYAVLTSLRLLIYENKEKYLNKKQPGKNFILLECEFTTNSNILKIKNSKKEKEYIFSSIDICNLWWETINMIKNNNVLIENNSEKIIESE